MKKKIKWEKWIDPLSNKEQSDENSFMPTSAISTPFGMVSEMEAALMSNKYFSFWVLYTNFDITNEVKNTIKYIPGIETLDIFSRYTARIGISKSGFFDEDEVKLKVIDSIRNLEQGKKLAALGGLPDDITKRATETIFNLHDKFDNWTVVILPNGHIESAASNVEDEEYKKISETLKMTKGVVGGRLITS